MHNQNIKKDNQMAKIFKYLPYEKFTKIENDIFRIKKSELCDGSKVMYGFVAGFQNGRDISDQYILKSLEVSVNSLKKYKRELKKLDLIHIERINRTKYDMYIGYLDFPASKVFEHWNELNSREGKALSLNDIDNMRK